MTKPVSVLLAAVLLLGPAMVFELTTRALIDTGRLPIAPSSNAETDVSLVNLLREGRPDVLILGSSSARAGIKPGTLARRIRETTGAEVRVRNVSQAGLSLEAQRLLVRELAARELLPDVLVTGLTPVTLSGRHGGTHDWFLRGELGQMWSGCSRMSLGPDWLDCQLGRLSAAWRWRGQPGRLAEALTEGMPTTIGDDLRMLHEDGWLATAPADQYQLDVRIDRALASVPAEIDVTEAVADDFAALVAELRAHGVTVIAFELPYLAAFEEALAERDPQWSSQVSAGYERLEGAAGIDIVELDRYGGWVRPESFRDPRHLSSEGAGPFTRQLWNQAAFREPLLESLGLSDSDA